MHGLRHKNLTSKQHPRGEKTKPGCIADGVKSKRIQNDGLNSERGTSNGVKSKRCSTNGVDSRSSEANGANSRSRSNGVTSKRVGSDGVNSTRGESDGANSRRAGPTVGNLLSSHPDGVTSKRVGSDMVNSTRGEPDGANPRRVGTGVGNLLSSTPDGVTTRRVARNGINQLNVGSDGGNSQLNIGSGGGNSQLTIGQCGSNSQLNIGSGGNSQQNISIDGGNSQLNIGSDDGVNSSVERPKRGRGWLSRTKPKMPPRSGKVELEPRGHSQFKYVAYNPKSYKYPSQIGTILKREYPGIIKVYGENGTVVKEYAAFCWNDYYWKKNRFGVCYAQRVKQEFWNLFAVHPRHRARAQKNLENYLVRRVTNMMYQVRLDAVKIFYHKRNEECDDTRARTIELTEEQYLTCWVEWCNKAVWDFLSKYWNSEEYKKKRQRAQEANLKSEDPVQNRGGSRNFAETQQFLEYTFGLEKSGTLNTYAVMKSGIKNVDSIGRSGPIHCHKAQKRLDDYKALAPDENTQELDGKALYTIGNGMKHGRVPIGDGAVDKAAVLIHAKTVTVKPTYPDDYHSVLRENEQLKETNEMLVEENCVNRELIMRMYADFQKEPPADLLQRLANLDTRRHQSTGSPHEDNIQNNDGTGGGGNDDDDSFHEGDDDDDSYYDNNDQACIEGEDNDCLEGEDDDNGYLEDDDSNDLDGHHVGSKGTTPDGSGTRATNSK